MPQENQFFHKALSQGEDEELARRYDPEKLRYGYNTVDGEEIFFVPNPALGLWIDRQRFRENP